MKGSRSKWWSGLFCREKKSDFLEKISGYLLTIIVFRVRFGVFQSERALSRPALRLSVPASAWAVFLSCVWFIS